MIEQLSKKSKTGSCDFCRVEKVPVKTYKVEHKCMELCRFCSGTVDANVLADTYAEVGTTNIIKTMMRCMHRIAEMFGNYSEE